MSSVELIVIVTVIAVWCFTWRTIRESEVRLKKEIGQMITDAFAEHRSYLEDEQWKRDEPQRRDEVNRLLNERGITVPDYLPEDYPDHPSNQKKSSGVSQ